MATAARLASIIGTLTCLSQSVAVADDAPVDLIPVEVRTDDVVVTATRFPETDLDRPVNLTVISSQEI